MGKIKYKRVYLILAIYIIISFFCVKYIPNEYTYVINPIFLGFALFYSKIVIGNNQRKCAKSMMQNMIIIMLIYFIFYELLGLIIGFAKNPYSLSMVSIIKNIWSMIVPIICIEYIRGMIVDFNDKNYGAITLSFVLIFFLEVNLYSIISNMTSRETSFIFICSSIVPTFSMHMLYTYLSYKGSYKLVLLIRLIYQSIFLFVPILPNLDWFGTGIVGVLFPAIVYFMYKFQFDKKNRYLKRSKKKNPIGYVPFFACFLIFAGFMAGLFKYSPVAIASNSMNELFYRGDVVVMRKVDKNMLENLQINDIIIFRVGKKVVVHRIIEINKQDGILYFKTKGDNNPTPDSFITKESDVLGLYQFHIKFVGYPSVMLNDYFSKL